MLSILRKPHPFIFNKNSVLIPAIITFLVLILLSPFRFDELKIEIRVLVSTIISFIVGLSIFATIKGLQKISPNFMKSDDWTIGKELFLTVLTLIVIIICTAFSLFFFQDENISFFKTVLKTASITLVVSIFPILVLVLFEQYKHQKKQSLKAISLTKLLKEENDYLKRKPSETTVQYSYLLLKSEKEDVELKLKPSDLIYLKSDGNYVEVFFNNRNTIQKKLIRNRLKNIEKELPNAIFFRCHNSFIVNGNHIINVVGNARNLVLELKNCEEQIPVSRSKVKAIDDFLKDL